jgi:hypothetical protein
MLVSFLHAAARGAKTSDTTVLLHDCQETAEEQIASKSRKHYRSADEWFHIDHSGGKLCVFKRRENTTDKMLFDRWNELKSDLG